MNPWLDPEFAADDEESDHDTDASAVIQPSPLTRRIVVESPRRVSVRKGYGWFKALESDTQQANRQLDQANAVRLTRAAPLPVARTLSHRILGKAMLFYDDAGARRAFLGAQSLTPLWPAQVEGVAFMARREQTCPGGGVIAKKMRKGKTLMIFSHVLADLQAHVKRGGRRFGAPTLFLVPLQAVGTIVRQLHEHFGPPATCPLNMVVISRHHKLSDQVDSFQDLFGACDIIVSTYNTILSCYRRRMAGDDRESLLSIAYRRVVADEAHLFCNQKIQLFQAMMALKTDWRWFVTGTPIRNSVTDLLSPLTFLRLPAPLPRIDDPRFKQLLHSVMIRDRDEPTGVALDDQTIVLDFGTPSERRLYALIKNHTRAALLGAPETQKLALILRMRQVCVEPHLIADMVDLDVEKHVRLFPMRQTAAGYIKDCFAAQALAPENDKYQRHDRRRAVLDKLDAHGVKRLNDRTIPFVVTKTRAILEYHDTCVAPAHEKMVVFSSWANYLDTLGAVFTRRSKLRGESTTPHIIVHGKIDDREALFTRFREDPTKSVLLLTFGTGGVSLDLTCANHVITPDPWFNPYTEDQAIARLDGVRQTRPIHIRRFVIRGTIDEQILSIKESKRQLESWLLADENIIDSPVLTTTDMAAAQNPTSILIEWIMSNPAAAKEKKRKREGE